MTRYQIGSAVALLVLLGAWWLRVRDLAAPDFWSDEAYSLYHLRSGTIAGLFESLSNNEETPPLYFLTLAVWSLFGATEFYTRALSTMFGTLAVAGVVRIGRAIGGIQVGAVAGGFMTASYLAVILSRQARAYGLGMMLVVAVMALTFKLIRQKDWRDVWLWILASGLCLSTNYLTGVMIAASWLSVLMFTGFTSHNLRRLAAMAAGVALIGLGLLPLLLAQTAWSAPTLTWIPPPSLRLVVQALDEFTFGAELRGWPRWMALVIIPAVTVAVILGSYWIVKRRRTYAPLLVLLFLPLTLIYLVSFRQPIFLPRYTFVAIPPLCLALASALKLIPVRLQWMGISLIAVSLLASSLAPYPFAERIPWSAVAARVAERVQLVAHPDEGIIFSPLYNRLPFELQYNGPDLKVVGVQDYADYAPRPGQPAFAASEADVNEHFTGTDSFWLVEDKTWPVAPLSGWVALEDYDFSGARLIRYQKAR